MTRFQAAYSEWRRAFRAAVHPRNLEYRCNMRYRMWERPDDPGAKALCDRLVVRLEAGKEAEHVHSDAFDELNALWMRYSCLLRPVGYGLCTATYDRGWP